MDAVEKLHLKFLKYVLAVNSSTCTSVVYGELGRFPIKIKIQKRLVGYWARTLGGKQTKLSCTMMKILRDRHDKGAYISKWMANIKNILDRCGLSSVWESTTPISVKWLVERVERTLQDQFLQNWRSDLESKSSCDFYRNCKVDFKLEHYLTQDMPNLVRKSIVSFRTSNSKIPKVTGRYKNIPRNERKCTICDQNTVGDEFHLLAECTNGDVIAARDRYLPKQILRNASVYKCAYWMRTLSPADCRKLGYFLRKVLKLYT